MMIKGFSVLGILKNTFWFFGNKKAMKSLSVSYLIMSIVFASLWKFFPFFQIHENHMLELNMFSIGAFCLLVGYFSIMIVSRVQQYIFFDNAISYSYFYQPKKEDFKLAVCLFKMFSSSLVCSYVSIVLFSLLGQKFLNIPPLNLLGTVKYTIVFVPYFLILQCYRLPACVAGEKVGFFRGFRKSNQVGMFLCVIYLIISILPFVIAFSLFVKIQFDEFFNMFIAMFSGFISIQLQAAFLGYMYAVLKNES